VVNLLRASDPTPPSNRIPDEVVRRLERLSSRPSWGPAETDERPEEADCAEIGRLGHYRVIELIGRGGMGLVYRAEDAKLLRPVALKLLRPRLSRHELARQRFLREARAMAALKHDHVVTVFEVGESQRESGPVPYLAMELLEGESLATWMQRNPPASAERVARIGHQAALGLAAAHARGLIHRDIKPGNLWLEAPAPGSNAPRVKLLDFGLADPFGPGADTEGRAAGTPAYMAPEQARGEPLDARADLYALGVVLHELATGRLPRNEPGGTFVPVRQLAPALPAALAQQIEALLAPAPAQRPSSADAVATGLAALCPAEWDTPARRRRVRLLTAVAAFVTIAVTVYHFLPARKETTARAIAVQFPAGLSDAEWEQAVHELPIGERYPVIVARLRELNSEFRDPIGRAALDHDEIVELELCTDRLTNISPLRACSRLRSLSLVGSHPGTGRLVDLTPLQGVSLAFLDISNNPGLRNLGGVTANVVRSEHTGF